MLHKQSITALQDILAKMSDEITDQLPKRDDFEQSDKYLQKSGDYSKDTLKGERVVRGGDKSKISNIEIPVTHIYKESAEAFLISTFLTGNPIFSAVASKEHENVASQLTALTARDQHRLNWVGELGRCLDDVLRYNICAAEINWGARRAISATTKISEKGGNKGTGQAEPIIYEGNIINRRDPYNLIYDRNVEPSRVHIDGTYAGYFEMLNYIQLKRRFFEWNDLFIVKQNIEAAFKGSGGKERYYKPIIRKDAKTTSPTNNWSHYWGNSAVLPDSNGKGMYELVTLYKRIIPKEHHIRGANDGVPQVYKLIWVNNHLIYAEPVVAGHEFLPIIIGQMYAGDENVKSFVEYLQDLQDLATALMTGSLDAMRRAVGDRALYDPHRIRKADIESTSPVSKIPVTGNTYEQNNLASAYYQIPYHDTVSPLFSQNLGLTFNLAEQTTGINRSAQGNFIKGNKTLFEFDQIMSNSQARLQLGALRLENYFFAPLKEILKINYLIYAQAEEVENLVDHTTVKVDPVMLRKVAPAFKMADGIMPATKLANTEVLVQASQAFAQNPILFIDYDIPAMWVSVMKQQGLTDVEKYRRTDEQKQQFMQQMQALNPPTEPQGE